MGKKTGKIIAMLICIAIVLSLVLSGCGTSGTNKNGEQSNSQTVDQASDKTNNGEKKEEPKKDPKKIRVDYVAPMVSHPFWVEVKRGFDDAIKEFGFDGTWMGADDHSVEKTVESLELAVSEKPDAIIACPFVPSAFSKVLDKAKAANIPVINVEVDSERADQRVSFIGPDWHELAQMQSEALYKKAGDPFKVGVIMSNLDSDEQNMQVRILEEYMKNIPGAEIVDKQEDRLNAVKAMEVLSAMIKAHPEMNAVYGTAAGGVPGFAKVIEEMKLVDKITVLGMDDTDENLDAVRKGFVYGVMAQDIYALGYLGGKYAFQVAMGEKVPENTKTRVLVVTKENVDTYRDK